MTTLADKIAGLPTIIIGNRTYIPYLAVTDTVAAFLFPNHVDEMDEDTYVAIVETAVSTCSSMGFTLVDLQPPEVGFSEKGRYWLTTPQPQPAETGTAVADSQEFFIAGSGGMVEMLEDGFLIDARLGPLDVAEVSRQHFKIPVLASEDLVNLMHKAVKSDWPNDYKGIWHDLCWMSRVAGRDVGSERHFQAIVQGVGRRKKWDFKAVVQQDYAGAPYMYFDMRGIHGREEKREFKFELGHLLMTFGAAELGIDLMPYVERHVSGDWQHLEPYDRQQNKRALKEGARIFTSFEIPFSNEDNDCTETIFIITESDRAQTTIMCAHEY